MRRYMLAIIDECEVFVIAAFMMLMILDPKQLDTAGIPTFVVLVLTTLLKIWREENSDKRKRKSKGDFS